MGDVGDVLGSLDDVQDGFLPDPDNAAVPVLPHIPVDAQVKKRKLSGKRSVQREWLKADLPPQEMPASEVKPRGIENSDNEVMIFLKLFGCNNINLLTTQTNMVRVQASISRNRPIPSITEKEIRQALGILMYMSVVAMPNLRLYWKSSLRNEMVAGVMTRDRFEQIVSCFHLSDNSLQPGRDSPAYDRLYKVDFYINSPSKIKIR